MKLYRTQPKPRQSLVISACVILCVCIPRVCSMYSQPNDTYDDIHLSGAATITSSCSGDQACKASFTEAKCKSEAICSLSCPTRITYPTVKVLTGTGACRADPPANPPSGVITNNGNFMANDTDNSNCTVQLTGSADASSENFGISFWIQGKCATSTCTVLRVGSASTPVLKIQLATSGKLVVQNMSLANTNVDQDTFFHVVITKRNNNKVEAFVDGQLDTSLSLVITDTLQNVALILGPETASPVAFSMGRVKIAILDIQLLSSSETLLVLDARFYSNGLTHREIMELYNGTFNPSSDLTECRCPLTHPDMTSGDGFTCTKGADIIPRLRKDFNTPEVILDGSTGTAWASTATGNVVITIDLANTFQITKISISYKASGAKPTSAVWKFLFDGRLQVVDTTWYSCDINSCTFIVGKGIDSYDTFSKTVTTKVEVTLSGRSPSSLSNIFLTTVNISGRCDCDGSATACTRTSGNAAYTCTCLAQTKGDNCKACTNGQFRKPQSFGCPDTCPCNIYGVININDKCESLGGKCKCKENVEGDKCDTCKRLTYNLAESNRNGCSRSSCDSMGSASSHNVTGVCNCRPNVTGNDCNTCKPLHFGLATGAGCKACLCYTAGTTNAEASCHLTTGNCACKGKVQGRRCDSCKDQYYGILAADTNGCRSCDCHPLGLRNKNMVCNKNTGQCPCRADDFTDRQCAPVVSQPVPAFGPKDGGTVVTIEGHYLNGSRPSVFIGTVEQTMMQNSDRKIEIRTKGVDLITNGKLQIQWKESSEKKTFDFSYKTPPVLNKANIAPSYMASSRGGCLLTLEGSDLNSVYKPKIAVSGGRISQEACEHVGTEGKYMKCPTPDLTDVTNATTLSVSIILDGVTEASVTTLVPTQPATVDTETQDLQFSPPFEKTITLKGSGLGLDCQKDNYAVLIGDSPCLISSVTATQIECHPPQSQPISSQRLYSIKVKIGTKEFEVRKVIYIPVLRSVYFVGIMSGVALLVIILLVIGICCCCSKCRNRGNKKELNDGLPTDFDSGINNGRMSTSDIQLIQSSSPAIVPIINPTFKPDVDMNKKSGPDPDEVVNTEFFLHRVEESIRSNVQAAIIGQKSFQRGTACFAKGNQCRLVDGNFTSNSNIEPNKKITIKMLIKSIPDKGVLSPMYISALRECLRLKTHKDDNVLSIHGIGLDQNRFYIIYPYMEKRTLKDYVSDSNKNFILRQLLEMALQVSEGMEYLSGNGFVHKDLAARNCMVDSQERVKIGDASFSWDFYPDEYMYDRQRDRYMPVRWMAPESLKTGFYDTKSDVWAFGVIMWELLTRGTLPFQEIVDNQLQSYIIDGYRLGKPQTISDDQYELMNSCWHEDSEQRPSFGHLQQKISTSLVNKTSDDDLYINTGADDVNNLYVNQRDLHL